MPKPSCYVHTRADWGATITVVRIARNNYALHLDKEAKRLLAIRGAQIRVYIPPRR